MRLVMCSKRESVIILPCSLVALARERESELAQVAPPARVPTATCWTTDAWVAESSGPIWTRWSRSTSPPNPDVDTLLSRTPTTLPQTSCYLADAHDTIRASFSLPYLTYCRRLTLAGFILSPRPSSWRHASTRAERCGEGGRVPTGRSWSCHGYDICLSDADVVAQSRIPSTPGLSSRSP